MAFCEQCGSMLEPNMKFCQSCGAKVAAAAAPATSSAVTGSYGTPANAGAFSEPIPVELSSGASGSFGAAASTGFSEPIMGAGDCAPAGTYGAPAQDLGGRVNAEAPQAPAPQPTPAPAPQPAPVVPEPTPEPEPVIETIPEPVVEFIPDPEPVVIPTPAPQPVTQGQYTAPTPQPTTANQGQYTAPTPQPTTANQGQYTAPTPPPAKPPKREKPAKSGGGKKGLKILLIIIAIIVALIVIASIAIRVAAKKALDAITEDQWEEAFEDLEDTYNEDTQEDFNEFLDAPEEAPEAADEALDASGENADTINVDEILAEEYDLSFWEGEWYGWWIIDSASGEFEELEGAYYDTCAIITSNGDGTGVIDMWDTEGSYDALMASADITFRAGTAPEGAFVSESGMFYDNTIEHADWLVYSDIVDATYDMNYDHMISIEGWYTNPENDDDEIRYIIYLRPWGMTWEDVEEEIPDNLPDYYYDWYLPLIEAGESMPHTIGE